LELRFQEKRNVLRVSFGLAEKRRQRPVGDPGIHRESYGKVSSPMIVITRKKRGGKGGGKGE